MSAPTLETERLILRHWREDDRAPFAAMNADAEVMEFFPSTQTREESDASVDRGMAYMKEHDYGLWALEVKDGSLGAQGDFVGFVGLVVPWWDPPFGPCVEIGWRLARHAWGHGFATEGAREALRHGFESCGLDEILSFTFEGNVRSRRVMERIGMTYDPASDFMHPKLDADCPVRPHVLYRLRRETWRESQR